MQAAILNRDGPFGMVVKWWRNWAARDHSLNELESCGRDEAAHIARDVGVSVCELQTLAGRWPESSNLLDRRMEASGLTVERVADGEPQVLRDLQRVCGQCDSSGRCGRDLDADERNLVWRDYCPNVATLDTLRREARDRRLMRRGQWSKSAFTPPRS